MNKRDNVVLLGLLFLNIGAGIGSLFIEGLPDHWLVLVPIAFLIPLVISTFKPLFQKPLDSTALIAEIENWLHSQGKE